ncbi:MAG TPA: alpha/beta fold hydrolase [Candidatus Polarisedimenticolia bacterium]|jgi:medium-chain acyl-[acyl-carrier-protein] hydrolase|nr:alpha/beta fold hydrolase [Candidatus Polarisedimenticolia bacterium]
MLTLLESDNKRSASPDRWFGLQRSKHEGSLRLFALPYAGAGASMFRKWSNCLPAAVELWPIQLPGRENRISEPPFTSLSELVPQLADVLAPYLGKPFIFFGHSMGALISFELARELRWRQTAQPRALFLSGKYAPQLVRQELRFSLSDDEFLLELQALNRNRGPVADELELLQALLPTIRADFSICDTYRYSEEPPLDCQLIVSGGLQDPEASPADIAAWRDQTTGPFSLRLFEGDHFFLQQSEALFMQHIGTELERLLVSWHCGVSAQSGPAHDDCIA